MTDEPTSSEQEPTEQTEQDGTKQLDDPAATLELLRKKSRELKAKTAKLREQGKELERLRQIEEASKTELEKLVDQARREAREEAIGEYRGMILRERVVARAARSLQDPEDAAALIDLSALDPDDVDGIDAALAALVEQKPYLAGKPVTQPVDQGARGDGPVVGAAGDTDDPNRWLRSIVNR